MVPVSLYFQNARILYNQIISEVGDANAKETLYARHDGMCMRSYSALYHHWTAEQFVENNAIADALLEIIIDKHGLYVSQN